MMRAQYDAYSNTFSPVPGERSRVPITFHSVGGNNEARVFPVLTAVVPVFNEEDGIPELHRRLGEALRSISEPFEIVLVNDGSRDGSATLLDAAAASDPTITVVHLSRNFGHQAAVAAGLAQSEGQAVVVLDADLQDPPELIPALLAEWRKGFQKREAKRV